MKAVNVDDVLKILHKYGKYIFVTDMKKYSSMVDEIANLKPLPQETVTEFADRCRECGAHYGNLLKKSEWEHDHEILKAYSDGASAVLDKVRAEIDAARFIDKDTKLCKNANASGLEVAMDIIDKFMAESED